MITPDITNTIQTLISISNHLQLYFDLKHEFDTTKEEIKKKQAKHVFKHLYRLNHVLQKDKERLKNIILFNQNNIEKERFEMIDNYRKKKETLEFRETQNNNLLKMLNILEQTKKKEI